MPRDLIAIEMHRDKRKLPVERTGIRVRDPSVSYFEILAFTEKSLPLLSGHCFPSAESGVTPANCYLN